MAAFVRPGVIVVDDLFTDLELKSVASRVQALEFEDQDLGLASRDVV
jgi:hypothetical protein